MYWEMKAALPWGDVHLPEGWHLGPQRVPVPAVPHASRERTEEILRRRSFLPPELVHDPAYDIRSPLWDQWFEVEHDARCRQAFTGYHVEGFQPQPAPPQDELFSDSDDEWSGDEMDLPEIPPPGEKINVRHSINRLGSVTVSGDQLDN
jgi:hypothetical protein